MNKKIIGIVIMTLLIANTFPVLGTMSEIGISINTDEVTFQPIGGGLDQKQTQQDGVGFNIVPSQWLAQGFKPSVEKLAAVQLYIFKHDNPPDGIEITVSIRETLNGSDLAIKSVSADQIEDYKWVTFNFPEISVLPENEYFIVCRSNGGSGTNVYCWFYANNNPYDRGDAWMSADEGLNWDKFESGPNYQNPDFCFKTYSKNSKDNAFDNSIYLQNMMSSSCGRIFIQLPPSPEASNSNSWTSSSDSGYLCYEDFWNVFSPICDVHWWGNSMYYDGSSWYQRDPEGMTFNISFWDAAGFFVTSYENVKPKITYTGIQHLSYTGIFKKLYYFETELDPCVELQSGWIGIHSTYCPSGGWLLWMRSYDGNNLSLQEYMGGGTYLSQDLAVVLTDGEPASPILECDGELRQTKVPCGSNVSGSFMVKNNGDSGSVLQWRIDNSSIPSWGSGWRFNPSADFQTPDMDWITINFNFTTPNEENSEFTGKIKVINAIDSSEYCEIDIYLKTPRNRTPYNTLLTRLFNRFPNILPIIRYVSGSR